MINKFIINLPNPLRPTHTRLFCLAWQTTAKLLGVDITYVNALTQSILQRLVSSWRCSGTISFHERIGRRRQIHLKDLSLATIGRGSSGLSLLYREAREEVATCNLQSARSGWNLEFGHFASANGDPSWRHPWPYKNTGVHVVDR